MSEPTPRQRDLLFAIERLGRVNHYPPSFDELAAELALSRARVAQLVAGLLEGRFIVSKARQARTIRLTPAGEAVLKRMAA